MPPFRSAGPAGADGDGLPLPQRHLAMATVLGGIGLSVLDGTVLNLALPGIAHDLGVPAASVIWVINAYQVAILALLLPLARMGDLFGHRRVYLAGLALFTLASLACIFASSLPMLCLARGLQGMGAAGMFAINAALVRAIYPRAQLGRGIALNSAVVGIGSVAGPTVAAAVLSVASWHWLFAINLPLGALVLLLGWHSLPRQRPAADRSGFSGSDVLLNIATFSLIFLGIDQMLPRGAAAVGADGAAQHSLLTGLAWLLPGVAVAAVYLRRQRRLAVPLLPIDLLRIPVFRLSMCASVTAFAAQMLSSIAWPFLLLQGLQRSHAEAGLLLSAWPLATVVVAPLAGRLIGRVHNGWLGGLGMLAMALGLALGAALPQAPTNAQIAAVLALCGAGFGLFQSPNNHTIVTAAPASRAGAAGGMLGTARLTGQSLGALVLAGLFGPLLGSGHSAPSVALGVAAASAVAAAGFSLLRVRLRTAAAH